MSRRAVVVAIVAMVLGLTHVQERPRARQRSQPPSEFITLGTASGPNSEATRAQPANALLVRGQS